MMIDLPQPLCFEWDHGNIDKNWKKHHVSQNEAESVFFDPYKLVLEDKKHSLGEARFIVIGATKEQRVLFIVFTLRDDLVRVISCRDYGRKKQSIYYIHREQYEKAA